MSFTKKIIKDIDVRGKRVLVRVDYNVSVTADGRIVDDSKLRASLPTLWYLLEQGAAVLVCSHMGRPDGNVRPEYSLFPAAKQLQVLLKRDVTFVPECTGARAKKAAETMQPGQVVLLENLRFDPREEANDDSFATALASYADIFVQDGFAVAYRTHASVDAVTRHLPSVAGLLLEREVTALTEVTEAHGPLVAVIGGASLPDKFAMLEHLVQTADVVAMGGQVGTVLLRAAGMELGATAVSSEDLPLARRLLELAAEQRSKRPFLLYLPQDAVVVTQPGNAHAPTRVVDWSTHVLADIEHYPKRPPHAASQVAANEYVVDIGPFSGAFIAGTVQLAARVVWSGVLGDVAAASTLQGPVGPYAHGSELVLEALTGQFGRRPYSVVAGDDSVEYVAARHMTEAFHHVSTGGGASNEVLAGHSLPGVSALEDKAGMS